MPASDLDRALERLASQARTQTLDDLKALVHIPSG